MTRCPERDIGEDGLALVSCRVYPSGKMLGYATGDPEWAVEALDALKASVIFVPVIVNKLFFREMEDRGVPDEIAWNYNLTAHLIDEVYADFPEGEAPSSRFQVIGIEMPPRKE